MYKNIVTPLIIFVLCAAHLHAQDQRFGLIGQHSVEADYIFGRIIKHNSKFKPTPTQFTQGFDVTWRMQTLGKKDWQRKLHCPELGASFLFFRHGDNQYFGNAYLLMGVVKFWMVRSKFVDFYIQPGMGLAFAPRHFNLISNPENVDIGSTINMSAQVKLGIDIKPHPNVQVNLGGLFTHYSNSATQFPNLGINTVGVFVGIKYFPVVAGKYTYNRSKWPKPKKKNEFGVKLSIGLQEQHPYLGPKFPLYIFSVNYARYTSIVNKVLFGASTEFSQAAYDFIGYYGNENKFSRPAAAMDASLFVGDEITMGKVSMFFIAGGYVFNPRKETWVYVKLGLNYYFASVGKDKSTKFFIGGNIKTHFFVAQDYEFSTGVVF